MDPTSNNAPAVPHALPNGWMFRRMTWVVVFGLTALGLVAAMWAWDRWGFPLWVPFHLDRNQPYRIELGRGSRMFGLGTVRVDQDGTVTLHRQRTEQDGALLVAYWETATLRLPPEGQEAVLAALSGTRVLGLPDGRPDPKMRPEAEWVLWVKQGEQERVVYCTNRFPPAAERFGDRLQDILDANGLGGAEWRRVPPGQGRQHERELMESLER